MGTFSARYLYDHKTRAVWAGRNTSIFLSTLFLAAIIFVSPCLAFAEVWYVDIDNVSGTEDGASWATAFTEIQSAIDAASTGDEVWVAEGAYTATTDPVVTMKDGISLYGGFAGSEFNIVDRLSGAFPTVIDGETVRKCITANGSVLIDGFVLTRGKTGLQADVTALIVRNTLVKFCNDSGAVINHGEIIIEDCRFENNTAQSDGGGVNISGVSSALVRRCWFVSNEAGSWGGGLARHRGDISIENCIFSENIAEMRIPTIPPTCSEGNRPLIPKDSALVFRLNRSLFSGRIGA